VPSYRVSFNATDNCSVSALSGIMNVASFSGFRVDFALGAGKTSSIEIDPKKQRVSLKGASETEMRSRLAQIAAAGGVSVANGQVLALTQATDPVVKLTFQNGQLTAMQASQLGLTVKASDSSGNVAVATSSL